MELRILDLPPLAAVLRIFRLQPVPSTRTWLRALGPVLVAVVLFAMRGWLRTSVSEFASSALWGVLLVVGYVGWGSTLLFQIAPARRFGWGLEAALGMAISLWVGASASIVHLVSRSTLTTWTLLGLLALGVTRMRQRVTLVVRSMPGVRTRPPAHIIVLFSIFALLMAMQFVGALGNTHFNVFDDNMGYRGFARKLLETGSMYEPFSIRRIGSYGGQTFLLASVLAGAPDERLHLLDNGVCVLIAFGLLVGYRSGSRRPPYPSIILALLVLLTLPHSPHNTGSELSGLVFFLAVFRLVDEPGFSLARPFANALPIGLVAAAACTLRQSYLPAAAGTVAFGYLLRCFRDAKTLRRRWIVEAGMVAGVTAVGLIPWMILSYVNAKTLFYPLMKGTTNPEFGMVGKVPFDEEMRWVLINLGQTGPVHTIVLFVLAGFLVSTVRRNVAIHAQLLGCVFGYFLLLHFFQSWSDYESVARYHFAFTVAYVLTVALKAPEAALRGLRRANKELVAAAMVTVAVAMQVNDVRETARGFYNAWLNQLAEALVHRNPDKARSKDPLEIFYEHVQGVVPENERLAVMLDYTHLLDYARNDILNLDEPGALSPPPGMPFHQGPEALADYFSAIGVRYIAFIIGETSPEYKYSMWLERAAQPIPIKNRGGLYRSMAPFYLDAFDNLMALTKSRKVLLNEREVRVLDLGERMTGAAAAPGG